MGDARGYYQDGAYTAAPDTDPSENNQHQGADGDDVESARQHCLRDSYYSSLISRFASLRQKLHRSPPASAVAALPRNHETEVGPFGSRSPTFRIWTNRIRYTDPLPAQMAAMDKGSALKLLRIILGGKFFRRGYELRERTSRWIWSLLARLPDRGEMDYTEVGWVRELGKRAVLMLISIAQMAALREEVEDDFEGEEEEEEEGEVEEGTDIRLEDIEEDEQFLDDLDSEDEEDQSLEGQKADLETGVDDHDKQSNGGMDMEIEDGEVSDSPSPKKDVEADIEAAKERLLAQLDGYREASSPGKISVAARVETPNGREGEEGEEEDAVFDEVRSRINTRATLNMILTVAGEFYGQRDLLEFRDPFMGLS